MTENYKLLIYKLRKFQTENLTLAGASIQEHSVCPPVSSVVPRHTELWFHLAAVRSMNLGLHSAPSSATAGRTKRRIRIHMFTVLRRNRGFLDRCDKDHSEKRLARGDEVKDRT
jgi:hypothetical protein